jgi:hypothetical protein
VESPQPLTLEPVRLGKVGWSAGKAVISAAIGAAGA